MTKTIYYKHADDVYSADSCEPLKVAAKNGWIEASAWSRGQYPGKKLAKSQLPGIRSIGTWDIKEPQDWFIPPHHNEGFEVVVVLSGNLNFEVDGRKSVLRRTSVTVTKPWQLHSLGAPGIEPNRMLYFILDVGVRRPNSPWVWPSWFLATTEEKKRLGDAVTLARQNVFYANAQLMQVFEDMYQLIELGNFSGITKISILINAGLVGLLDLMEERETGDDAVSAAEETVRHFLLKLSEHVSHPWRLEEMADQCGLSRSQFANLCKEITNQSPMTVLANLRLEKAASLLTTSNAGSVTDVCFECGFNSSQYFSKRFAERFGAAPREFRKRAVAG